MLRASGIFGDSRIDFLIRNITDSCYFSPLTARTVTSQFPFPCIKAFNARRVRINSLEDFYRRGINYVPDNATPTNR